MFVDEIRRAASAAARVELPAVSVALWQAFGAGQISEAEAEALSGLIEARKALPVVAKAPPRRVGSRPRTDASMARRRRWAASGRMPPALAERFTLGEQAVLAVVAVEVVAREDCRMPVGRIASVAGVSETTVRRALRAARDFGLVTVEERRLSAFRNDTNIVRIISAEWVAWMSLPRGGERGCQSRKGSNTGYLQGIAKHLGQAPKKLSRRQSSTHKPGASRAGAGGASRELRA